MRGSKAATYMRLDPEGKKMNLRYREPKEIVISSFELSCV